MIAYLLMHSITMKTFDTNRTAVVRRVDSGVKTEEIWGSYRFEGTTEPQLDPPLKCYLLSKVGIQADQVEIALYVCDTPSAEELFGAFTLRT